jgi:hypothetical protein
MKTNHWHRPSTRPSPLLPSRLTQNLRHRDLHELLSRCTAMPQVSITKNNHTSLFPYIKLSDACFAKEATKPMNRSENNIGAFRCKAIYRNEMYFSKNALQQNTHKHTHTHTHTHTHRHTDTQTHRHTDTHTRTTHKHESPQAGHDKKCNSQPNHATTSSTVTMVSRSNTPTGLLLVNSFLELLLKRSTVVSHCFSC